MELSDQIQAFKEFFEQFHLDDLLERLRRGDLYMSVPFAELAVFSPDLANVLLESPEDTVKAAQMSLQNIDLQGDVKSFEIRFKDLPSSQQCMLREIRAQHIGRFLQMEGIVRQKSDVRPQVTSARFECPSCGNIIPVLQLDQKFREPSRCGCGRKGKFRLLSKQLVDAQRITLEEAPEDLEGGEQPKRMSIILQKDLVSPMSDKKTNPGSKIVVTGIVKEVPITLATGGQSTRFDLMVDANFVDALQEDYTQIKISQEEEEEILEFADTEPFQRLVDSLAPTVYGHDKIKEALVLQLLGGCRKTQNEGVTSRGDIHVLLIGDPGSGKSTLLNRVTSVAPKARFVSGKGASGAGLTASVVKDDFLRGWALEAGALVLANRGLCCIDELDKMTDEDRSAMHEALEQQTVSISKANIQAKLRSETTVLAAANPKFGRFDPYELLAKQIDLPSTLINRFDLIFPVRDMPDEGNDERLAHFILKLHQKEVAEKAELEPDFIRKYISYARTKIRPQLTNEALEEIKQYYVKMRNSGGGDGQIKAIPISARQLEALVRLAEASAKARLSKEVSKEDAKAGIDLVHFTLSQIGLDPETGQIDVDRITTGITAKTRGNIHVIKDVINELVSALGDKPIPVEDLVRECELKGVSEKDVDEVLEKLKRSGDIYSPKQGFISKI